ncbi:GCSH1 [Auxenochlorella protothecoides x Auxenochlorella symbiontica]
MALRQLASQAASGLGLRCTAPSLALTQSPVGLLQAALFRSYSTVIDGLKYAESHEYAKIEGDVATLGITDFAQSELGDVVYVEVPEVGASLSKGANLGVVESVKAASDIYSPLSGEVIEVNSALVDDPAKINAEPFEGGWLAKIKLSDPSEADSLLDADAYKKHVESQAH